jgi:regulator of sigma E protease
LVDTWRYQVWLMSMDKEQMAATRNHKFRSKPAWQRLIIMLGGVTVNFILAFIIYIGMAFVCRHTYMLMKI